MSPNLDKDRSSRTPVIVRVIIRTTHADNLRCVVLHIPDVDGTLGTATGFGVNRSIAASI